jgi:EAL domain-containing protein (putative c-di-GMP-specific phosphodiesterase class I)
MAALAAGDYTVRLGADQADAAFAADFNQVASSLALLGQLDPLESQGETPARSSTALASGSGDQVDFIAIMGIDAFGGALSELELRSETEAILTLSARIRAALPGVLLGRVTRSALEFRFPARDAEQAARQLSALISAVEGPMALPNGEAVFKVSIGFAECSPDQPLLFRVMASAEYALAKARDGHAKVATFTDRDRADADDRKALAHDLSRALASGELSMVYQPKLSMRSRAVETAEALIRWRHPTRGAVSPADFIALAERSGEIDRITRFTLERAVADQTVLFAHGEELGINVNISGHLISNEIFVDWAIATAKASAGSIGFEITETAVISDPERALHHMRRIAEAGIPISIDDYGAGLSSLVYLKQFPAKELKIDRAFISELTRSHRDPLIVRSTIDLAHALEMEVTAEGVEDAMTLALLQVMGCDHIQGYHFARPMPLNDLIGFLAKYDRNESAPAMHPLLGRLKAK